MKKKLSSYQKLKKERDNFWRLYCRAMRDLRKLGEGIYSDDILTGEDT